MASFAARTIDVLPVASPSLPRPLRVLYLNYEWDLSEASGAATHMRELTQGLRALGQTVITCDRHRAPDASNGDGVKLTGGVGRALRQRLSPYLHEWAALARSAAGIRTELALIRLERPDVVLTRYSLHQFSSLVAAREAGVPVVFEVNAPMAFEYRRYRHEYRLVPRLGEWTEAQTLARADSVFVVSSMLAADLVRRGVPADRVAVVPNGADAERFRPDVADGNLRARCGADRVLIGFVGSFAGFHGVEMLRHAIGSVLPARPHVAFVMAGQGPGVAQLEAFCRAQGLSDRVVFLGFVSPAHVPGMMAAMDVLLAPYAVDNFFYFSSLKLFEYMASGRAVVAPRVGQVAEVIEDGVNGLLYDGTDRDAFASQVLRLVDDAALRAKLGSAARRTVETRYTWRINAEKVSAVLEAACRHRAGEG